MELEITAAKSMWRSFQMMPDMTVIVEGQTFLCHQHLLGAYSAYFNSLLSNTKDVTSHQQNQHQIIPLPRTSARSFAILLSFLYEGNLKISTPTELQDLILTAQYLHIPALLVACRQYLMENMPMLMLATNQYVSFPNQPPWAWACSNTFVPQTTLQPKFPLPAEVKSAPAQPVRPEPKMPTRPTFKRAWETPRNDQPNMSATAVQQTSPETNETSELFQICHHKNLLYEFTQREIREIRESESKDKNKDVDKLYIEQDTSETAAIIDIAACDGPVKFEKVLNTNYSSENCNPSTSGEHLGIILNQDEENVTESQMKQKKQTESNDIDNSSTSIEILDTSSQDETQCSEESHSCQGCSASPSPKGSEKSNDAMQSNKGDYLKAGKIRHYYCPYCDHSFKSYFCYEKHKQRHLHPIEADICTPKKILEMNVSFYPCKECGSKFPSYYFVHKHKRYCKGKSIV